MNYFSNIYIKTGVILVFSFVVTFACTRFVFYPETQDLRPEFTKIFNRITSPVIGGSGDPIQPGLDPTPPPAIYN